jgi:hypothetical protein
MSSGFAKERRYVRIAAPLRVFDVERRPPESFVTRNISLGGLFLMSDSRRAVASTIELLLEHRELTAAARGRVTHLQSDGFGVTFMDPSEALLRFVRVTIDDLLRGGSLPEDRRGDSRALVGMQVVWSQVHQEHRGRLSNLSHEGAYILCPEPPALETEVFVYLPGFVYDVGSAWPSEARGCPAKVVHRRDDGFGVAFDRPSAEFRMAIDGVIEAVRGEPPASR